MSSMVVRTNGFALNAHRNLTTTGITQRKASQRLSSGLRINSAADDAAGLAISESMRTQIRGMNQASVNTQDGIGLIQTAEGAMENVSNMVIRIRELLVQAANDTNTYENRELIQVEIDQLMQEINDLTFRTQFNTRTLLDGGISGSGGETNSVSLQWVLFDQARVVGLPRQNGNLEPNSRNQTGLRQSIIDLQTELDDLITRVAQRQIHEGTLNPTEFDINFPRLVSRDPVSANDNISSEGNVNIVQANGLLNAELQHMNNIINRLQNVINNGILAAKEIYSITNDQINALGGRNAVNVDSSSIFTNPTMANWYDNLRYVHSPEGNPSTWYQGGTGDDGNSTFIEHDSGALTGASATLFHIKNFTGHGAGTFVDATGNTVSAFDYTLGRARGIAPNVTADNPSETHELAMLSRAFRFLVGFDNMSGIRVPAHYDPLLPNAVNAAETALMLSGGSVDPAVPGTGGAVGSAANSHAWVAHAIGINNDVNNINPAHFDTLAALAGYVGPTFPPSAALISLINDAITAVNGINPIGPLMGFISAPLLTARNLTQSGFTDLRNAYEAAQAAYIIARDAFNLAQADVDAALPNFTAAQNDFSIVQTAFLNAQTALNDAQTALTNAIAAHNDADAALSNAQSVRNNAQSAIPPLENALTFTQNNYNAAVLIYNNARAARDLAQANLDANPGNQTYIDAFEIAETNVFAAVLSRNDAEADRDTASILLSDAQTALADAQTVFDAATIAYAIAASTHTNALLTLDLAQDEFNQAQIDFIAAEAIFTPIEDEFNAYVLARDNAQIALAYATTARNNAQTQLFNAVTGFINNSNAVLNGITSTRNSANTSAYNAALLARNQALAVLNASITSANAAVESNEVYARRVVLVPNYTMPYFPDMSTIPPFPSIPAIHPHTIVPPYPFNVNAPPYAPAVQALLSAQAALNAFSVGNLPGPPPYNSPQWTAPGHDNLPNQWGTPNLAGVAMLAWSNSNIANTALRESMHEVSLANETPAEMPNFGFVSRLENLLDKALAAFDCVTLESNAMWFQIGANQLQGTILQLKGIHTGVLGGAHGDLSILIDVREGNGIPISQQINIIENAQQIVSGQRAQLGAAQNRLEFTRQSLDVSSENLSTAESRTRDADMGREMMRFTKAQVLQQAGIAMLSQANQLPQTILQLLQ
ncbi:MAG: hypothetical protein FWC08_00030 [Defluviitaleaceae bacterium]|nr:hypothetical protein [Defluviitaleaceae bacterium]